MRNKNSINRNIEFEFESKEAIDLKSGSQKVGLNSCVWDAVLAHEIIPKLDNKNF